MIKMTIAEFHAALKGQHVPAREHLAFRCPVCGTVQSGRSLIDAGAGETMADVEKFLGFSCVGRFNNAGPYRKDGPEKFGCDWTLGGLFRLHTFEVVDEEGKAHPHFAPATPEEAQALALGEHPR